MKSNCECGARDVRQIIFLILNCLVIFHAEAQSNFQKGLVVMNNSDTLRGYIDQKEWTRNPSTVSFQKASDDHSPKVFTIKDILYFQVDGRESYQRFIGTISMDKVSLDNLGPPVE